jgi:signal transduction histidine kinase
MSELRQIKTLQEERANQFMVLDLLSNLLAFSENPGKMGAFLVRQVRELVGARIVALLTSTRDEAGSRSELIAFEPARLASGDTLSALEALTELGATLEGNILWEAGQAPAPVQAVLDRCGFNGAILSPLTVGRRRVGFLVAIHLVEMKRNEDTIRLLEILAPVVALAIQNATFFESLEARIQARTQDLRVAEEKRRTLEANFHQAQKLDALGTLASGVAHDMNNVLGAIQAVTETLQVQYARDPALASALGTIQHASLRGRDLVRGLTKFARKEVQETRPLDLNQLIREEVSLLQRTLLQKVRLVEDLQEGLPAILGEEGTLGSVLMNLCVNAVDAMPEGGALTLRTRSRGDGWVEMVVEDQGEGMSPEVLKRAMEPFFTTKPFGKGTGLGLSMVYNTVKVHGGVVNLQSAPGQGTVVTVSLPGLAAGNLATSAPPMPKAAGGHLRILLVDDDELIRAAVPAMLQLFGHTVEVASGGHAALERLDQGGLPDLVILDLNMPEMGGAETLRRMRKEHPALPVLIATGHLDSAMEMLLELDPCALSITKPFSMDELRHKLLQLGLG